MEAEMAVRAGVWKITQNVETLIISISEYEHVLKEIEEDRRFTHEELYDMLCRQIHEIRGEV